MAKVQEPLMKRRANYFFTATLLALDAGMICLAFFFAYYFRPRDTAANQVVQPFAYYFGMMGLNVLAFVAIFFFYKLYHLNRGMSRLDEIYQTFPAASLSVITGTAFTAFAYRNELDYPRIMIVYFWFAAVFLIALGRFIHHTFRSMLYERGWGESRVLIVGAGEAGSLVLERIRSSPQLGYRPVGFLDDVRAGQSVQGLPVIGRVDQLGGLVAQEGISEVVIALPEASNQELLSVISQCEDGRVSIKIFPDVFQLMASEVNVGDLNGLPLLTLRDVALRGWRLTLKRFVDFFISGIVLILISPILILVAVAVKLDSRGPSIFSQTRMGLDARPFPVFKFRSMHLGADEEGSGWTVRDDPRRTRLGAFLRRYSLDELPNFINVFLGHMSLVGPRPEQPIFVEQFRQQVPRYMERHQEKAGITGWAQINGLRGDTSILERTKYDLYYIEHWSLWLDLKIMILTLVRFLRDPNAI